MRGGKYARQREKKKLSLRQILWLSACGLLAILSVICWLRLGSLRRTLPTQSAAEAWRGDNELRFSQISVFLPVDGLQDEDAVRAFRQTVDQAMVDASLEAPENGQLYTDAYSGTVEVQVSGPVGKTTVKALGVGGDFFTFHPLPLRSGSYLTSRDYMADRVVLDEELAWALFGSSDVAGMDVTIGDRSYPVAGVVRRERDFATKKAYTQDAGMFMDYAALKGIGELRIDTYEIVMPSPISGYAEGIVQESFPVGRGVVVENTNRFSFVRLCKVLLDFGERSMNENGVLYPYWENAARMVEDHAALALLLAMLLAIAPVVTAIVWIIRLSKNGITAGYRKVHDAVEQKVEAKKEANYVRKGI